MLIRDGGRVLGVSLAEDEKRFDIGNFESYFEAFVEFALSDPLYGAELRAKVAQLLAARRS
jgi:UTP--glucose-1-phosphate uridylyltransferase